MNPERNIIVIPAVLLMLLLCGSLSAQFSGGSGSERDPYLIATTGDLDMIRSYRSSHFLQTADIDLNVYPYNDGIGWFPIGIDSSSPFTGSFDGDGHHIINLFINNPMHAHVGLFGYLSGAKILRVNLDSVNITCDYNSGTLAGVCVDTDIMNCSVSGTIQSGDHDIGGLVAYLSSGCLVSHCYTSVIVSGGHYVGGIASWLNNSEISDCHALGSVQGLDSCG